MKLKILLAFLAGIATTIGVLAALYRSADSDIAEAKAEVDVYYPGTENLAPDEMRVVALGTGMASPRPKQSAACWLVELGNGDKFLFDVGAGCHDRIVAQKIPYDYLDKVFLGHLHVDHFGD
ncbi:MAG: MBL fold metallo-hydrolase, partial [Deltaproteobacteria bacterium]|nr:MBL fold metallo-hydrolase [Deltaproteobacteria bacterium]